MSAKTIVSAPGKVLLTGGYLVLDREYTGLVVGADSRFYTAVGPGSRVRADAESPVISVKSPQFLDGSWTYAVDIHSSHVNVRPLDESYPRNPYVEAALVSALNVICLSNSNHEELLGNGLDITIVGSNDFYSQREQLARKSLPLTFASLAALPPFCPALTQISKVHKTGLGSSAAMITSLVGAVLAHFGAIQLPPPNPAASQRKTDAPSLRLVHNTAQLAHCIAQGNVGSGFDVSAAVYGSHRYRRFSPTVLSTYIKQQAARTSIDEAPAVLSVVDPADGVWDNEIEPFSLPPRFALTLADIDAGSSTPRLVSKVLEWRKQEPEKANALWSHLGAQNSELEALLRQLSQLAEENRPRYDAVVDFLAPHKAANWEQLDVASHQGVDLQIVRVFIAVHSSFLKIRSLLREMSAATQVPIEPAEQTRLLDACMDVPGIIMAGVPGAGGFDAIFCIALSDAARTNVETVWQKWTEMAVAPLLARESSAGLCSIDAFKNIPGLLQTITDH
ncbi:phosphomevalonate kinase [Geranomyces michiganensis]|nr:phosphomevalonate kinase [Geranomyces michiganensis]